MKTKSSNKKFNRKLIQSTIFTLIILMSYGVTRAQSNACGCEPVTTLKHFVYVTGCTPPDAVNGSHTECGHIDPTCNCYVTGTPESAVIIQYREVTCGGSVAILFDYAVFYGPLYSSPTPGNFTNQAIDYPAAQQALLGSIGGSGLSFVYPAGCQTVASVAYPNPSPCYYFWPEGPLAGQVQAMINMGNPSPVLELVPCDGENCCKLDYTYDVVTHRYTLVNFNPIQSCPSVPPSITTKQFHCMDKDNKPVTYTGTVTFPRPCESYCGAELNTLFKTTKKEVYKPLPGFDQLSLSPIPAKDFIYFSATKEVKKVEIYDAAGKKVDTDNTLENEKVDISRLTEGVYYVRVHFSNNALRTIKIVKQ